MSNIGKHMEALVPGIASAASEREKIVGNIRLQTAHMLRDFGRERRAMAKVLKSDLATDRKSMSVDVLAIRDQSNMMREGFRRDHLHMRRSLRKSLLQSREAVVNYVAFLRVDFAMERASFSKMLRHTTKAQCSALAKGRRDRSHAVVDLIKGFHASRGAMAQELADTLAKSTQGIKAQVSDLRCSVAPMLKAGSAVKHSVQNVAPRSVSAHSGASLSKEQVAEPFTWPISAPAHKLEHAHPAKFHEKPAAAEAGWNNVGKSGKPKKK